MELKQIEISNFRQFYSEHTLKFNTLPGKKVTLIRGQNGSGKTALLNAFLWCLYGETTEKFKNPEKLISLKAIAKSQVGNDVNCKVSIVFDHDDGLEYTIERELKGTISSNFKVVDIVNKKPYISTRYKNGETRDHIGNPQEKIHQLLPEALAPYFFFDGENLQHMTEKSKNLDIAEAIRLLMGVTLLKRTANDLTSGVYNHFKKLKEQYGSDKSQKISKELEKTKQEKIKFESQLKTEEEEIEAIEKKILSYDKKLNEDRQTRETKKQLEEIRNKIANMKNKISENQKKKVKIMSSKGFLAFIKDQISNVEKIIEKSNKDGIIPKGYKTVFIEGLLKSKECICGNDLSEGSQEFNKISLLKEQGGNDDIESKVGVLNERIRDYKNKEIENFKNNINDCIKILKKCEEDLKYSQEQESGLLEKLKKEAGTAGNEENLAEKKLQLEKERRKKREKIGGIKRDIEIKIEEIEKKENELSKSQDIDNRGIIATKRMNMAKKLGQFCQNLSDFKEKDILKTLKENVENTFQKITIKPFNITLSPSYEFQILNKFGENDIEIGESTGESQMLSLAFIGNLLKFAKDLLYKDKKPSLYPKFGGGIYPLIIDSPFGQIDDHHRPQIIKAAINLSHQMILFVSGSQWDGEIDNEVRPYIASEYLIKYHKPKEKWTNEDDDKNYSITINNAKYNFVEKTDDKYESSQFEEV